MQEEHRKWAHFQYADAKFPLSAAYQEDTLVASLRNLVNSDEATVQLLITAATQFVLVDELTRKTWEWVIERATHLPPSREEIEVYSVPSQKGNGIDIFAMSVEAKAARGASPYLICSIHREET